MKGKGKNRPLAGTECERIKLLAASGKTANYIGKGMGRNRRTVQKYLTRPEVRQAVSVQREELAEMFDHITHRILSAVSEQNIEKAGLRDKLVSAAISTDKSAMLRGEFPTQINVTILLDAVQAAKALQAARSAEAMQRVRTRMALEETLQLPAPASQ